MSRDNIDRRADRRIREDTDPDEVAAERDRELERIARAGWRWSTRTLRSDYVGDDYWVDSGDDDSDHRLRTDASTRQTEYDPRSCLMCHGSGCVACGGSGYSPRRGR
jgi:hypothetical protein